MNQTLLTQRFLDGTYCQACNGHMIKVDGKWHHGTRGEISYADDLDHKAIPKGDERC